MAEEKGWKWAGRLLLAKNLWVWLWPLIGGPVTFYGIWLWSHAKHLVGPEIFVISLLGCFLIMAIPLIAFFFFSLLAPRVKGNLTPVTMNSTDARVTFKNQGKKAAFFVKCEFIGQINTSNVLPEIVYDLAWENQTVKMLTIGKGDSAHLILAKWRFESTEDGSNVKPKMGRAEFRAFNKEEPEYLMLWHSDLKEQLPACDIKLTVLSDGGRGTLEKFFTIEPKHFHGPLLVSEYSPSGKDGKRVRP